METEGKIDRHCAACRKLIPAEAVKKCSKCRRRAYCSKECQARDWSPVGKNNSGGLQGHKNWCGIPFGEEDVDWKVAEVAGKGRGIIAMTHIPAGFRIILESDKHAKSIGKKFNNSVSLVNHDCDPNAKKTADIYFGVWIVVANREIKPGEEICVNYIDYTEAYELPLYSVFGLQPAEKRIKTMEDYREVLIRKYRITCPSNCVCWMPKEKEEMLQHERKIFNLIHVDKYKHGFQSFLAIRLVEILLEKSRLINGPQARICVLQKGFQVAAQQEATLEKGLGWIKEAFELSCFHYHKKSALPKRFKIWLDEPRSFENYGAAEGLTTSDTHLDFLKELTMTGTVGFLKED